MCIRDRFFTPAAGPVGTAVTLIGTGFSGAIAVTFNGSAAAFRVVSDTQITAAVPAGAGTGLIAVTTPGGTAASAARFIVSEPQAAPTVTGLKPASAKRGRTVTISGSGFGAARGASSVKFGSKACTKYVSWSDAQIKCKVPAKAKYGTLKVTVTTAAGTSNSMAFRVKR